MQDDNQALIKLKQYLAAGHNYYEATEQLRSDGFTSLQIDNANSALKSNRGTVTDNPILAESLLSVEKDVEQSNESNKRRQGTWLPNTAAYGGMSWLPKYISSWWWIVAAFLIIITVFVYIIKSAH